MQSHDAGKGKGYGDASGGAAAAKKQEKAHNPDIICLKCGEKGHIVRQCTSPANPTKVDKARAASSLEMGDDYEQGSEDDEIDYGERKP